MDLNPSPSPTGTPVLQQWAVRIGCFLVAAAGVALPLLHDERWRTVCQFVIGLGAAYGIASQGVRK